MISYIPLYKLYFDHRYNKFNTLSISYPNMGFIRLNNHRINVLADRFYDIVTFFKTSIHIYTNKFFTHCTKTIQKKVKTWLYRRHPHCRVSYFAQNKYSMICLWPAIFSFIGKDALSMEVNQMNGFVFFSVTLVVFERFSVDFWIFSAKKTIENIRKTQIHSFDSYL